MWNKCTLILRTYLLEYENLQFYENTFEQALFMKIVENYFQNNEIFCFKSEQE